MPKKNRTILSLEADRRMGELTAARVLSDAKERIKALNRLVRTWIEAKLLEQEPALQEMAWVEYRYMGALDRTELFTRLYHDIYIELYREFFPEKDADKKQPVEREFFRNDVSVMKALWSARMAADACGVPYDVYISTLMRAAILNDHWKNLPRPSQLYGDLVGPRMRDVVNEALLAERLYATNWDARFRAVAYCGDPAQEAALALLVKLVNRSGAPAETLAEFLCERQVVTEERAVAIFGPDLVETAKALTPSRPAMAMPSTRRYVPACVGFPEVSDDSPCARCPVAPGCLHLSQEIRQELIAATGSDDPRKAWKRHKAKIRKRDQRKRERLEASMQFLSDL
jgi:hypothetical protein